MKIVHVYVKMKAISGMTMAAQLQDWNMALPASLVTSSCINATLVKIILVFFFKSI